MTKIPPLKGEGMTQYTSSIILIRRLFTVYLSPYRWHLGGAIILMIVVSLTTGTIALMTEPVINSIFEAKNQSQLILFALMVTVIFMLRGFAGYGSTILLYKVSQQVLKNLRKQLHTHLLSTELMFFHATPSGHVITHMINDTKVIESALGGCMLNIVKSGLTMVILIGIMFYQDWILALCVFITFPSGGIVVTWIGSKVRHLSMSFQAEMAHFTAIISQTFHSIRSIQVYRMQEHERHRISLIVNNLCRLSIKNIRIQALGTPVMEILSGLAITVLIVYVGSRIIDNTHTAGTLISFILAFLLAYDPMRKLNQLNAQLQRGLASVDRVFSFLDRPARHRLCSSGHTAVCCSSCYSLPKCQLWL